jgi:CHAT domain-containing protein/Tfp pilus assembly protein PilF
VWSGHKRLNKPGSILVSISHPSSRSVVLVSLLFLAALSVSGETRSPQIVTAPCAATDLKHGLVVEGVAKNSEGEKAGLAEGDIVLSWARGSIQGEIESPFDLSEIEIEQEPRGPVTLEGTRAGLKQAWIIGPDKWDVQTRPNFSSTLLATYLEGQQLAKVGKLRETVERWRAAAVEGQANQCSWLSPWFLSQAAEALANAQQWKDSGALYLEAIAKGAEAGPEVRAQLLQALAGVFERQSDSSSAEKYQQKALKEIEKRGLERLATAASLNRLGRDADDRGDLSGAEAYFHQALAISVKLAPGSLSEARSLHSLGSVADERGDLDKAEEYNRQALDIRTRLTPGSLNVAASLNNLGNVADDRGDLDKAEDYYRQALDIRQELVPASIDVVQSLNSLGNIAADRGNLGKAQDYYGQALEIGKKLAPDSLEVAASLNNLGLVANERGDLAETEDYFRQALEIRKKLAPGSLDVAASLNNLGNVEDDRGDRAQAEDYYRQALIIGEKLAPRNPVVPTSLYNLAEDSRRRGNLVPAKRYLHQLLAIYEKDAPGSLQVAMVLASLGEIARTRGDLAKASYLFQKSLTIDNKLAPGSLDVATGLNNLGEIERDLKDLAKSEEYYRQSLEIRKRFAPESASYAESLATLAGIMRDRQQSDEAVRLYAQAIDVLESQVAHMGGSRDVRADFRAKHADYYSAYADLLLTQKQPELAFQVLERSRARTLLETLAEGHINVRQGAEPSLLEQEQKLQVTLAAATSRKINLLGGEHADEQIAAVGKEIDGLLRQYQEVEEQIRTNSPRYAALTQPQPLSAKEVQDELLDADTLLLEYSLQERRSFVFAVTPTTLDCYELPGRSEIENAAHRVYDLLTSRNRWIEGETSLQRKDRLFNGQAEYQKAAATLSRMILGPVAEQLEGKRLLIVADGALQYVPFSILPDPARNAPQPPVPLVAKHEIVNLPSASVLASLRRQANGRGAPPNEVAVLADPVFDKDDPRVDKTATNREATKSASENEAISLFSKPLTRSLGDIGLGTRHAGAALSRLAFSRREADAIMAMTDPGKSMEALDFRASREMALSKDLGQYRIVHFATHGLLDNQHPELSGLVLSLVDAEGKSRDGFLDMEDVYNLTLPADLVVLSACETGLGKQITGEGLVGLTRGFMYAGASRVVASLWNVDDAATAELMGRFYRGLLKEGLRPAEALRQAQIEMQMQKRWADPYYWAAFTIQGEWK